MKFDQQIQDKFKIFKFYPIHLESIHTMKNCFIFQVPILLWILQYV